MEEIKVFTGAELNDALELHAIQTDLQNHLVFDHSYTDNINLCITVLNLILVIYVYYKLNTNKNG
jgi:hypothetical protein